MLWYFAVDMQHDYIQANDKPRMYLNTWRYLIIVSILITCDVYTTNINPITVRFHIWLRQALNFKVKIIKEKPTTIFIYWLYIKFNIVASTAIFFTMEYKSVYRLPQKIIFFAITEVVVKQYQKLVLYTSRVKIWNLCKKCLRRSFSKKEKSQQ